MSSSACRFSSHQTNPEASSCVSASWRRGSAIQKSKETRERHDQLEIGERFQGFDENSRKRLDLAIASGLGDASRDNDRAWLTSRRALDGEPFRSSLPLRETFSIWNISETRWKRNDRCEATSGELTNKNNSRERALGSARIERWMKRSRTMSNTSLVCSRPSAGRSDWDSATIRSWTPQRDLWTRVSSCESLGHILRVIDVRCAVRTFE